MNKQKMTFLDTLDTIIGIIEIIGIVALILFCGFCILLALANPRNWEFIFMELLISAIDKD